MNTNDLMLGNLLIDAKGRICKVEQLSIDPDDTKIYAIEGATTSFPIVGIPITEDWLDQLGLTLHKDGGIFMNLSTGMNIHIHPDGNGLSIYDTEENYSKGDYVCTDKPIKFLHHLQNIYYWLTGEKLTLNLK